MRKRLLLPILFGIFILGFTWRFINETKVILRTPLNAWTEDQTADCAVVLTGSPGRVREGFDLLTRKSVRKLIISGVNPKVSLREIFPNWPFYGNLNPLDVILEKRSGTTYGNAQQTLVLVEALHCRDIILITSRLHMHRAHKTFVAIYPADFPIYNRAVVSGSLTPGLGDLVWEVMKSLFYGSWAY